MPDIARVLPMSVSLVKCKNAVTIIFFFTLDQFLYPGKCFSRHQSSQSVFTRTFYFLLWTNDTSSVIRNIKLCLGPLSLSLFSLKLSPSSAMNGDRKDKKNISSESNDYLNEITAAAWDGDNKALGWLVPRLLLIPNYCQFSCFAENSGLRGCCPQSSAPLRARAGPDWVSNPSPAPARTLIQVELGCWKCCFYCQEEARPGPKLIKHQ